jgi:O-antigen/teichoic acid export membrane protein
MLFLLALVPLLMGIGSTMSDAIRAVEKPRLVFYAYVSSAVATFALGMPLVKYFGLRGAVYGMLVSAVAYSGTLAVAFRINVPKPIVLHAEDIYRPGPPVPSSEAL